MVLQRILRAGEGKIVKRLKGIANAVNSIEEDFLAMTDAELSALWTYLRTVPVTRR